MKPKLVKQQMEAKSANAAMGQITQDLDQKLEEGIALSKAKRERNKLKTN